jgi:hypothetical protein
MRSWFQSGEEKMGGGKGAERKKKRKHMKRG